MTHIDHWVQGGRGWTTTETLRFPTWSTVTGGLAGAGFTIMKT